MWSTHFLELGSFADGVAFHYDPTAFGDKGADIATIIVNDVEIEAAEFAANDIRFSATFPDGHSIYGGETFYSETDGRGGLFGALSMQEAAVEANSALNALLVFATMKSIANAVTRQPFDEIRRAGGIVTPTGKFSSFD